MELAYYMLYFFLLGQFALQLTTYLIRIKYVLGLIPIQCIPPLLLFGLPCVLHAYLSHYVFFSSYYGGSLLNEASHTASFGNGLI